MLPQEYLHGWNDGVTGYGNYYRMLEKIFGKKDKIEPIGSCGRDFEFKFANTLVHILYLGPDQLEIAVDGVKLRCDKPDANAIVDEVSARAERLRIARSRIFDFLKSESLREESILRFAELFQRQVPFENEQYIEVEINERWMKIHLAFNKKKCYARVEYSENVHETVRSSDNDMSDWTGDISEWIFSAIDDSVKILSKKIDLLDGFCNVLKGEKA